MQRPHLSRPFWLLWWATTASSLGDGVRWVAFPLIAASITHDPGAVALVSVAGFLPWPLFGVAGTALAGRAHRALGLRGVLTAVSVIQGAMLIAVGLTSSVIVCGLTMLLIGLTSMIWNIITVSLRQRIVPAHLLGRVTSSYRVIGLGAMPLGALAAGVLARAVNLHAPFLASGLLIALAAAICLPLIGEQAMAQTAN